MMIKGPRPGFARFLDSRSNGNGNHRRQLSFSEASVIAIERKELGTSYVLVRIDDVSNHYEHVKQSGARIINPPADYPFGERQYTVEDIGGHHWTFSQTIADVDPTTWGGELPEG